MRLYIMRHADPDYENDTITEAGHLEAAALAERLAKEGITRIYTSPLGRARHTMQYTAERTGLPFGVEEWTAELGDLRIDLANGEVTYAWLVAGEIIRSSPRMPTHDDWHRQAPLDDPGFVEVFRRVKAGSDAFLARHGYVREGGVYRMEERSREKIAVFTHAGFALTWLAHLLELPVSLVWAGFHLSPSSVTTVLFEERSEQRAVPRCIALGDTAHLYHASLPERPRGLAANFH